jgi:2-C-methyl-D-erythritol 2,4-cyclodiphosphate synthase
MAADALSSMRNQILGTRLRIGHGFDVHRLSEGRKLMLAGVEIPHPKGLSGHSDADVATHALIDALLGAAGLGDIGMHFPDSDPAYRDASSIGLLRNVCEAVTSLGFRIANIDVTIVAQEPKIGPHRAAMVDNLASASGLEPDRVNVKATTTEGLGFTGRKEGIAAFAVVLLHESDD